MLYTPVDHGEAPTVDLELPASSSVALQRLIEEVRSGQMCDLQSRAYNRTYHRHNR